MARVFISYRRADGQYAVGWIEERLRQLEEITDLRTAFRDSNLRHGDDFPARLAAEVEQCDVLVAVIGPNWRGETVDGPTRILDPADWVGREITSALANGKRIIPVLLTGAEPLQATELLPAHQAFADLHAVRFDTESDLDALVNSLRSHLDELDRERARSEGLDEPIVIATRRPTAWALLAAAVAAVIGELIGRVLVTWALSAGNTDALSTFQMHDNTWVDVSTFEVALWALLGVLGVAYFRVALAGLIQIRWRSVAYTAVFAVVVLAWGVVAFGASSPLPSDSARTWLQAILVLALMSPWIIMMVGAGWSRPASDGVGGRVRLIATQHRALTIATPAVVVALLPPIWTTAALSDAVSALPNATETSTVQLLALGVFLSMLVGGILEFSHSSLRQESELLRREIAYLAPTHRRHAEAALVGGRRQLWLSLMWWALLPTVMAVLVVVI